MAARKSGKKNTKKMNKKKAVSSKEQGFMASEIAVWCTLAVSVILLLGLFGIGGFIGEGIKKFLMTCFGYTAYGVPFLLFGGVAFGISNTGNVKAYFKILWVGVLFLFICALFALIHEQAGGTLGEFFSGLLVPAIGLIGSYVVIFILMIISIVLLSGKSLLHPVKKHGSNAYKKAREDMETRKMKVQAKKTDTVLKRTKKRAEGVSFATTLDQEKPSLHINLASEQEAPVSEDVTQMIPEDIQIYKEESVEVPPKKKIDAKELQQETGAISRHINNTEPQIHTDYHFPPMNLLKKGKKVIGITDAKLRETASMLEDILANFGVKVTVTDVSCGPSVTRYELQPEIGVKVSKIVGLADDIKLNLAAPDIRIEAPIPGKAAVGIEVPNKSNSTVMLRDLLESETFKYAKSDLSFVVGKDISGKIVVADIAKMPHLLIAGATGSGKSVCINTLIMSILYKASPADVKFLMIDPKVVELSVYNGIPHLLIPVVTDPKKAAGALNWAVAEMTRRYHQFAEYKVRDMKGFNQLVEQGSEEEGLIKMPQIVIIVDELADLMMVSPSEVEESICRLAQLARAAGIHLVIATQRPSVNVITGLIKANMPSRIAFSVTSGVDSRTIIDMNGAEKLLGKGDMLFYPAGYQKPVRVQGAFVYEKEVGAVVDYLKDNNQESTYDEAVAQQVDAGVTSDTTVPISTEAGDEKDAYFKEAGMLIIEKDKASIGMLQRAFKIGFNRAARIMDQLHEAGVVGGEEGTKPRKILMSIEEFSQEDGNEN